jgi:hypothetical protein
MNPDACWHQIEKSNRLFQWISTSLKQEKIMLKIRFFLNEPNGKP